MSLRRVGLSNSLSSQAKITSKRLTLSRVSLRRFPFPTVTGPTIIPNYIEDVFSTYLYRGNGSTGQTISNGIDLSTKGGMVWAKARNNAQIGFIFDTNRGNGKYILPSETNSEAIGAPNGVTFLTNGFSVQDGVAPTFSNLCNQSGYTYASWTFREQAKFFDIVTYTGNGVARTISHSLGSTPGCMIIKNLSDATYWAVYHRGITTSGGPTASALYLNRTDAATSASIWNNTAPTDTVFSVGSNNYETNLNGNNYVAYLFAHDAGGFGLSGSDNIISCGSFTSSTSAGVSVTLGYEPQLIIAKLSSTAGGWYMIDNMRGMPVNAIDAVLQPNSSAAEDASSYNVFTPTATGFIATSSGSSSLWGNSQTVIYIAIRRGPMKTPTSGTSVFSLASYTGDGSSGLTLNSGIVSDAYLVKRRTGASSGWKWMQRLISYPPIGSYGPPTALDSTTTAAESAAATWSFGRNQNYNTDYFEAAQDGSGNWFVNGSTYINYALRRAPGFFDVVPYTGNGVARSINHNLTVVPELLIIKRRTYDASFTNNWAVWTQHATPQQNDYSASLNLGTGWSNEQGGGQVLYWGASQFGTPNMTSTTFSVGTYVDVNANVAPYVAYLFASLAGVSKVGTYTGDGSSQTINCGFTTGARFILIKRIDTTGAWYVWDTARGIVSGNDPWLNLNATSTEIGTSDSIDPDSTGFIVNQLVQTDINVNGGKYLFLAIA
jgi:hypothetical protein